MADPVVADTHAVVWYLAGSKKLSDKARDTMRETAAAGASIYVSAITLVELVYLTERGRIPDTALERLEQRLKDPKTPFHLVPIDTAVVEALKQVPRNQVPDMPDRLIAATALAVCAPLVTADTNLNDSDVETIW